MYHEVVAKVVESLASVGTERMGGGGERQTGSDEEVGKVGGEDLAGESHVLVKAMCWRVGWRAMVPCVCRWGGSKQAELCACDAWLLGFKVVDR